jgi:hypothetical protein
MITAIIYLKNISDKNKNVRMILWDTIIEYGKHSPTNSHTHIHTHMTHTHLNILLYQ